MKYPRRDWARDPAAVPPRRPDLTVAQTILAQLGGRQFIAMTGAKDLVGGAMSLSFKIPRRRRIKGVHITLTPADTYTVDFYTWAKRRWGGVRSPANYLETIAHHEGVYADQLAPLFTQVTGLHTSLGTCAHGQSVQNERDDSLP